MSYTKRQFVEAALDELGLTDSTDNEQKQQALQRLDSMLASWSKKGIRLGYPLPNSPSDSSLDEDTGVPDSAEEVIVTGLAKRLAPTYGKTIPRESKVAFRDAYRVLLADAVEIKERQFSDSLPRGSGHKPHRTYGQEYFQESYKEIQTGKDGDLEF